MTDDMLDFATFTLESALHEVMQRREEMELARNQKAVDFYATWEQAFRALQYGLAECTTMKRTYANLVDRVKLLERHLACQGQTSAAPSQPPPAASTPGQP